MPQTTPNTPPQVKAILATAIGVVFLTGFGAIGYWYGTQHAKTDEAPTANLNSNTSAVADTAVNNGRTITGTVTKVSANSVEISRTLDGQAQTILAKVSSNTLIQKWDFRTSKSSDKGVGIKLADLKPGARVLVSTMSTESSSVDAQKVSLVIYP